MEQYNTGTVVLDITVFLLFLKNLWIIFEHFDTSNWVHSHLSSASDFLLFFCSVFEIWIFLISLFSLCTKFFLFSSLCPYCEWVYFFLLPHVKVYFNQIHTLCRYTHTVSFTIGYVFIFPNFTFFYLKTEHLPLWLLSIMRKAALHYGNHTHILMTFFKV